MAIRHAPVSTLAAIATLASTLVPCPPAGAVEDKRLERALPSSEISPDLSADFGAVLEGQAVVLVIRVQNRDTAPLEIGAVRPLCACMSEESARTVEPGQTGAITLRLETLGYSGPTTEAALIQWVGGPVPVTRVEMKLDVQAVIEVKPRKLVRFRTVSGQAASEELEIRTPDGAPLTITEVESSSASLHTELRPEGSAYRLRVTLDAATPVGMIRERITLHTDLPTLPELEIKVTGAVTKPKD